MPVNQFVVLVQQEKLGLIFELFCRKNACTTRGPSERQHAPTSPARSVLNLLALIVLVQKYKY
jgi:hypothetical protein